MPQVHPQCIFANAAYNPCECIAILNKKKNHRILFYIVGLPCILDRE